MKQFEETILEGVQAVTAQQKAAADQMKTLTDNIGSLSAKTQQAFADLEAIKRVANEHDGKLKAIERLHMQLQAERIRQFGNPIARITEDPELRRKFNATVRSLMMKQGDGVQAAIKALGEDSGMGATLIDDALASTIYSTLSSFGVWNQFGVERLGTKQTKFPVETADPVCNVILTEGDTIGDDSTIAGSSVTCEVELLATLLNVSIQLLEDSEYDVTSRVLNQFARATAKRLDYLTIMADGSSDATNGGMTGIFNAWTAATAATGNTTVENTDLEDWTAVLLAVDPEVLGRQAKWFLHPRMLVRALSIKDSNGRSIFLTANEAPSYGAIGTLLGYPVVLSHIAPSTNSAGGKVAAFGDPMGMVVGIRRDFTFESSDHHKWNTFQRSFRGIARAGVKNRVATAGGYLKLAAA